MNSFSGKILKIDINPYLLVPATVRKNIFKDAGGTLNGHKFTQTLVKFKGRWRLYLNTPMRKAAGMDVGDMALVTLSFDSAERITPIHPKLKLALQINNSAKKVFDRLSPSRQKEIKRYINNLKTEISVDRNVDRAIKFLLNNARSIGRDKPL